MGLLLLVAMVSAGVSIGKVHAHADGDHDHEHSAQFAADMPADPVDPTVPLAPEGDLSVHEHDVGTTVSALPVPALVMIALVIPATPSVHVATLPAPSTARIPPHRPPIA